MFKDAKKINSNHKLKKDRQYNGKKTNNRRHNTTQKTKDFVT